MILRRGIWNGRSLVLGGSRARHLAPDDCAIAKTYQAVFNHYGIKPEDTLASIEQKAVGRN